MSRTEQAPHDDHAVVERQRLLVDWIDAAQPPQRSRKEKQLATATRPSKAQLTLSEMVTLIEAATSRLEERLAQLEGLVQEVRNAQQSSAPAKEYYTTAEAAQLLGKRPYTVREWCRLGRVRGEKAAYGRGLDEEWRISHDELVRVQNEGLLRVKRESRVSAPARVGK